MEPVLIFALTKIHLRTEVMASLKQAQSFHSQIRTTLMIDKTLNHIILLY
jgi:hypothetical protein